MTGWVIDASIAFAWVHPAQATSESKWLLEEVEKGAVAIVPLLWFMEVANGLLVLQRRKRFAAADRMTALRTLASLNLVIDDESGHAAFTDASELADQHGLTVYDAIYLEVALRRKVSLASRDELLRKAAKSLGVPIL